MSRSAGTWVGALLVVGFAWTAACADADMMGTPIAAPPSANDAGDDGASGPCQAPHQAPMDPSKLPSCCDDGQAHCVPSDKVSADVASHLAKCSGGYCVPDENIVAGGMVPPPSCKSMSDADGVCLSVCIPEVAQYKTLLPQSTCDKGKLCAPCINPLTKQSSGACDIGKGPVCQDGGGGTTHGDDGGGGGPLPCPYSGPPIVAPKSLPSCAPEGGAHCLDKSLVPQAMQSQLASCNGGAGFCVPDPFIETGGNYVPPTCDSLGGDEGRCLHDALPAIAKQKDKLPVSSCKPYERCAPCFDPRDLSETGACKLSCDPGPARAKPGCPHQGAPYMDPSTLTSCSASNSAHCLDSSMVSAQLASQLATCPSGGICVPDVFSENAGRYVPPTCDSLLGAEGRCLDVAIPKVADQVDKLPQSTCAAYERCVPCYSPVDGSDTGACKLSCDPGPQKPAVVFQDCCSQDGKCVPTSIIPQKEQQNLSADTCSDPSTLCVPTEMLASNFSPDPCTAFNILYLGNYQGVCLSNCLSFSFLQSLAISQGNCNSSHQCVPCTQPNGTPSGAPGCP